MALQPLSIGDILMLSQTAWKIGRAFANGTRSAPAEFAEVEREANSLSDALKLVAEALHTDNSILSLADQETKNAVNTILDSAQRTLSDLESFVERYQVIKKKDTKGGVVTERKWSDAVVANYRTFKWTTEGGDIKALRDKLQMHTNSLNLTMQALQSRSLARLENTVVPMAENITSIYERVNGDLGDKITELHTLIMSLAVNRAPSLRAIDDRPHSGSGSSIGERDSISSPSVGLLEQAPPPDGFYFQVDQRQPILESPVSNQPVVQFPRRQLPASNNFYEPSTPTFTITEPGYVDRDREDSAVEQISPILYSRDPGSSVRHGDWNFESGSPPDRRPSIGSDPAIQRKYSDSGHTSLPPTSPSNGYSPRPESSTLPRHLSVSSRFDDGDPGPSNAMPLPLNISPRARTNSFRSTSSGGSSPLASSARMSELDGMQPPVEKTPSLLARSKRAQSQSQVENVINNFENPDISRPHSVRTNSKPIRRLAREPSASAFSESHSFERHLFRNSAILCDVRGKLVEYAQVNPDEPDSRYNVEMVEACRETRICVVRRRENREVSGVKCVTSIWCLSDDGERRIQQKLSEVEDTIPFCSYFEPEKVSLQPTSDCGEISLRFHDDQWGAALVDSKRTNWVNYYFASENDAIAFQSAVFGRMLLGSYRTTKTTVLRDGLKGAFAFEEQFANIEMLRLWEDDGVATPGAAGGVLALMHISSSFGEGWARWWINSRSHQVKVKEDGQKHARVKGIDVTVAKPRKATINAGARRPTNASSRSEQNGFLPETSGGQKKSPFKKVDGVRIEFKTEAERTQFVGMVKRAQVCCLNLPDL